MLTTRQIVYITLFVLYYVPALSMALLIAAPVVWGGLTLWGIALIWLLVRGIPASRRAFDNFLKDMDDV